MLTPSEEFILCLCGWALFVDLILLGLWLKVRIDKADDPTCHVNITMPPQKEFIGMDPAKGPDRTVVTTWTPSPEADFSKLMRAGVEQHARDFFHSPLSTDPKPTLLGSVQRRDCEPLHVTRAKEGHLGKIRIDAKAWEKGQKKGKRYIDKVLKKLSKVRPQR